MADGSSPEFWVGLGGVGHPASYGESGGYGASYATVRVYIFSQLVFEIADLQLTDGDLWEVCTIVWPAGWVHVVTDLAGQYRITSNYPVP